LHERAARIYEASYGPDHPDVADSLNNLAGVLCELDQPTEARSLLERALRIWEASYGPDHPATQRSREWLRMLYNNEEEDAGRPSALDHTPDPDEDAIIRADKSSANARESPHAPLMTCLAPQHPNHFQS